MTDAEGSPERRQRFHFPIPDMLLEHVRRQCSRLNVQPTVYIKRAVDVCLYMEESPNIADTFNLSDIQLSPAALDSIRPDNAFGMMCEDEVQSHLQRLADFKKRQSSTAIEPWRAGYTVAPLELTHEQQFSLSLIALRDGYEDEQSVVLAAITRLAWMYEFAFGSSSS